MFTSQADEEISEIDVLAYLKRCFCHLELTRERVEGNIFIIG